MARMETMSAQDGLVLGPAKGRGRWLSRSKARKIAVMRDVLASAKDAGLILGAIALLSWHDQVADFLSDLNLGSGPAQVFDAQAALRRLARAADTQPTVAELPTPIPSVMGNPLSEKALRAERRLLASEDAEFISDWVIVVATTETPEVGNALRATMVDAGAKMLLVRKGGRAHLVLPVDGPAGAQSALNRLRPRFPAAVAVSQRDWCDADMQLAQPKPCRRP
jgi:hypothetical protein